MMPDAFGWGEWMFGAATGNDRCVAITLGTGIGSAFLADGEVRQSGAGVPAEGRVDLLRISGQPLEEVVSTRAIERAYQLRTGIAPRGTCTLPDRRAAANQAARSCFHRVRAPRHGAASLAARTSVPGCWSSADSMTGSWDLIGPALLEGHRGRRGHGVYADSSIGGRPSRGRRASRHRRVHATDKGRGRASKAAR